MSKGHKSASASHRLGAGRFLLVGGLVVAAMALAGPAAAATFSNSNPISGAEGTVPCGNGASYVLPGLYGSPITVSGLSGTTEKVSVTLSTLNGWNNDFDVLLVGPAGQRLVLLSDSGGAFTGGVTVSFTDDAPAVLPANFSWGAGPLTARPTDYLVEPDVWPSPAPGGPYQSPAPTGTATLASVFNGSDPNGTWTLYLTDDCLGDPSSIAGGWTLDITASAAEATLTLVTSSANPSFTGDAVTFTAAVTKAGTSSPVANGTVTFREGAVTLASNVTLDASGRASFTTAALAEGSHVISAFYSGATGLATSNGSVTQVVDNRTTVSGNSYCNPGAIAINDGVAAAPPGLATPYPSRIMVAGLGAVTRLSVTLRNVSHSFADDIDVMLVAPSGAALLLVSDAGGGPPAAPVVSDVTIVFDDAGLMTIANDSGGWGAAGSTVTFRPVDYTDLADVFPAPAPPTYSSPAPAGTATLASFNGQSSEGTWSLYVVDDGVPDTGVIAGGWCLSLTTAPEASDDSYVTDQDVVLHVPAPGVLENDAGVPFPAAVPLDGVTSNGGSVVLAADGGFSYTAPVGFTGTDTFVYTVTNGGAVDDTATVTVTVNSSEPPTPECNGRLATIVGSPGDTVIMGTDGDDVIVDLDGSNTIFARGGNDRICTGEGDDKIVAADGDDWVDAGAGKNNVTGGAGADVLHSGSGDDKLAGEGGDDVIDAGAGKNNVSGGTGDDTLIAGSGDDAIDGGTGFDSCAPGGGKNKVRNCEVVT